MDWTKRILAKVGLSPGYPNYFPSDLDITPESNVLEERFNSWRNCGLLDINAQSHEVASALKCSNPQFRMN